MPERAPHPPPVDQAAISAALHTDGSTTTDLAFGRGHRFELNDHQVSLEIFPEARLSRITTPAARVELFTAPPPQVLDGQVILRDTGHEDVRLAVDPEGRVIFCYVYSPPLPAELPQPDQPPSPTAPASEPVPPPAPPAATPVHAGRRPPPTPTGARVPTGRTAGTPEHDQAPRVQLTGRLGRDPSFRATTKTGTLVGRFPLAEHHEDGTTRWHTVLAFGDRAKQLQRRTQAGELAQGREVEVVGYLHTNTRPGKDGRPRSVQEVYATAVTRH